MLSFHVHVRPPCLGIHKTNAMYWYPNCQISGKRFHFRHVLSLRLDSSHWPTKESRQKIYNSCMFLGHGKICLKLPQMGPGGFFLLIQTLPTFWATHLLILRTVTFRTFGIPNSQISRSPEIWPGPGLGRAGPGLGFGAGEPRVGPSGAF